MSLFQRQNLILVHLHFTSIKVKKSEQQNQRHFQWRNSTAQDSNISSEYENIWLLWKYERMRDSLHLITLTSVSQMRPIQRNDHPKLLWNSVCSRPSTYQLRLIWPAPSGCSPLLVYGVSRLSTEAVWQLNMRRTCFRYSLDLHP